MFPRITNDIFLLHLPLKAAQRAFQRFSILYEYVSQAFSPFHTGPFAHTRAPQDTGAPFGLSSRASGNGLAPNI
jgi:hypothetical protein